MSDDPFASIAEPAQTADPFASIAESATSIPESKTSDNPSLLSRVGHAITDPIGSHFSAYNEESKKLRDIATGPPTLEQSKHPIGNFLRRTAAGIEADTADVLNPLFVATVGGGQLAKTPGAVGKIAKTAMTAGGIGFGAQGAHDVVTAGTDDTPEAWGKRLGGAGMMAGGAAGVGEMLKGLPSPKVDHASNLSSALEMGGKADKSTMSYEDIGEPMSKDVRAEAARQGVKPEHLKGRAGYVKGKAVIDGVRQRYNDWWHQVIDPMKSEAAPKASLQAATDIVNKMSHDAQLLDMIEHGDPFAQNAKRVYNLGKTVSEHPTIGGLEQLRIELNRLSEQLLQRDESGQYTASLSSKALDASADSIRDSLYEEVAKRYGGVDVNGESRGLSENTIREMQRRHGKAIRASRLMDQTSRALSSAESEAQAPPTYWQRIRGSAGPMEIAGRPKLAATGIARSVLGMTPASPMELFNARMSRVLKGATAEEGHPFPEVPMTGEYVDPKTAYPSGNVPSLKLKAPPPEAQRTMYPDPMRPGLPSSGTPPQLNPASFIGYLPVNPAVIGYLPEAVPPESLPYSVKGSHLNQTRMADILNPKLAAQQLPKGGIRVSPDIKWNGAGQPEAAGYTPQFTPEELQIMEKAQRGQPVTAAEEAILEKVKLRVAQGSDIGVGAQGNVGNLIRRKLLGAGQ